MDRRLIALLAALLLAAACDNADPPFSDAGTDADTDSDSDTDSDTDTDTDADTDSDTDTDSDSDSDSDTDPPEDCVTDLDGVCTEDPWTVCPEGYQPWGDMSDTLGCDWTCCEPVAPGYSCIDDNEWGTCVEGDECTGCWGDTSSPNDGCPEGRICCEWYCE